MAALTFRHPQQLEDEEKRDEEADRIAAELEARPKAQALTLESLAKHDADSDLVAGAKDDDDISVARSVMSEGGRSITSVHSTKSIAAIAERAREKFAAGPAMPVIAEQALAPPAVVRHTDDDGAILEGKQAVAKLPYMHRNPAI